MQTVYKRFSVVAGFILMLIVLAANAFITQRQLSVQVKDEGWVTHTQQVLYELSQTESLLREAEVGQRGYLYTGNAKYLAPYNTAILRVNLHVDNVAGLTVDNPRQQARIRALRDLVKKKLDEMAQTLSLYQSGKPYHVEKYVPEIQAVIL